MSISWGSWEYSGGNGMRLGVDLSAEPVDNSEPSCTFTAKFYTQNQYRYDDNQTLNYSSDVSGTTDFSNNDNAGDYSLRSTKTFTHTYGSTSYGTSPGTVRAAATLSGAFNGVTPSHGVTMNIPARPYATPSPPSSVTATRNSDTQATVGWSRNATSGKPYTSMTLQRQYFANGAWSGWGTLSSSISGSATSYVDTTTKANYVYRYQIRANNSVGSSIFAISGNVYMTPAAPSSVLAAMQASGTAILVTWVRADYKSSDMRFTVQRSVAGAAYTTVASLLNATTWTDAAPGAGTNQYRVQAVATAPSPDLASALTLSNVISTIVAPLAPSNLAPNGVTVDLSKDQVFSWKHNPGGDAAPQSKAEISTSLNAGANWVVLATLTQTTATYLVPGGSLAQIPYQWRVRTQGVASAGYGPYSAVATITGRSEPTVTLDSTDPPPVLGTTPLTASWAYAQAQGDPQAAWQAEVHDSGGNLLETTGASDAASSVTFATTMVDGESYTVRVRAMSSTGLWSAWASTTVAVDLLPPVDVDTVAAMEACTGTVTLDLTPEISEPGVTVPVDYVDIQRRLAGEDWVTIMTHVEVPASVVDLTPPTVGTVEYRVVATSVTPSQAIGPVVVVVGEDPCDRAAGQWVFLNYGLDFATVLRFHGDPGIGSTSGRNRAAQHFLGRAQPVMLLGQNTTFSVRAQGALHFGECCYEIDPLTDCEHDSPVSDWEAAGRDAGVVLYRDWTGRRLFGLLSDVETTDPRPNHGTVSLSVTQVEYTESIWTGELAPDEVPPPTNLYCYGDFEDPEDIIGLTGSGSAVLAHDTTWESQGDASLKITPNGVSNASGAYLSNLTNDGQSLRILGLEKGRAYTISADIKVNVVQTGTLDVAARTISAVERRGGTNTATLKSAAAPNALGVYRLVLVYLVPSDAPLQDVSFRLMDGSSVAAQTVNWDAVMIEEGETEGTWGEGCLVRPTNLFAMNPSFEQPYAGTVSAATVVRSSAWASQGAYCVQVTPTGSATFACAFPAGSVSASGDVMRKMGNLVPGGTYTVSADVYMPTAQIGTPSSGIDVPRSIVVSRRNAAGTQVALANSPQLPNVAGAQARLKVTFTVPSTDISDLYFKLMNGTNNPADVLYWDAVMVEEGTTEGVWSEGVVA